MLRSEIEEAMMVLPPVTITKADRERLVSTALAALGSGRAGPAATMLLSGAARARIVAEDSLPAEVVAVQSEIEIRDNIANTSRRLRLVYPEEAALDDNLVSILTPLGALLIGSSVGDTIDWCTATGDRRCVSVLRTWMNRDTKQELSGRE